MHLSPRPLPQRPWRAGATATGAMLACAAALPPGAHAAAQGYPKRMQQVMDYIQQHPMQIGSAAMLYEPTEALHVPLPEVAQGLTASDVLPGGSSAAPAPDVAQHFARTVAALLYVAVGGLDHAHNLVTPLAWGSWTSYAGKPIQDSPAFQEAAYVHALVHRAEGFMDGEFGTGFSNANYWYRTAAADTHPITKPLVQQAQQLAAGNPKLEQLVALHGDAFQPTRFVTTCSQALASKDQELVSFCNAVAQTEWSLLLQHCYRRMQEAAKKA